MNLSRNWLAPIGAAALLFSATSASAALSTYGQDFEGLNAADPNALANDGWLAFGNVFDSGGGFLFGYGPFGAPTGGSGFSAIDSGQGGPAQGAQQLSIYNDYNCCQPSNGHFNGTDLVESNVFQEQVIDASDVGSEWIFTFDGKAGNIGGSTSALAFIQTLDPNAGFSLTNFVTVDTTNLGSTWGTYTLSLFIDPSLAGQILQFGFASTTSNFQDSGNFYDNVSFTQVPLPAAVWLMLSGLIGLAGIRRRS